MPRSVFVFSFGFFDIGFNQVTVLADIIAARFKPLNDLIKITTPNTSGVNRYSRLVSQTRPGGAQCYGIFRYGQSH